MGNQYNVVLYGQGLLNSDQSTNQRQLEAIQNSGFTTVLLLTIHVWPNGDLYYGDTPAVQNGTVRLPPEISTLIQGLREGGVQNVLASIGSADAADFEHLKALLATTLGMQTLNKNFRALVDALDIDGFDFDLEEFPLAGYADTIVKLTLMLSAFGKRGIITYCPYNNENFWLICLAGVYSSSGNRQLVKWINLQCYSGSAGNDPNVWAQQMRSFSQRLGISDPDAFIVPGYSAGQQSPADIQETLSGLVGLSGAFIWNLGDILSRKQLPVDYAQVIVAGLEGENQRTAAAS